MMKIKLRWFKDKKFFLGIVLVILSFALGFYGKALFIFKFYEPFYFITGLSIWAFSWILLFFGAFLLGAKTMEIIQKRIKHEVKKTVRGTYNYTRELPKKSYDYTKKLQKNGIDKITKASKAIKNRIKK